MSKGNKPTLSDKIRALFKEGYDRKEIEKKLGVSPQLIYAVAKKEGLLKKKKKAVMPEQHPDPNVWVAEKKYVRAVAAAYKNAKKPSKIIKAVQEMTAEIEKVKSDLVNNPPHYRVGGIDTLDFIEAKDLNFRLANVVKYVVRCGRKADSDPVQDLEKAAFYLKREIDARKSA